MRTLIGFCVPLVLATGLAGQYRGGFSNPQPFAPRAFGNAVFPGGVASFGNAVFPGGTGPRFSVPGSITDPSFGMRLAGTVAGRPYGYGARRGGAVVPLGYPVYVGGYGYVDNSGAADQAPPPQQQPNVVVVYPQPAAPVIINYNYGPGYGPDSATPSAAGPTTAAEPEPVEEPASTTAPSHYLIAFKDHSVYSAVAYWVDGDTLHYFTSGNTHNQASLSLVDRDLTKRLNDEAGLEVRLPPAK